MELSWEYGSQRKSPVRKSRALWYQIIPKKRPLFRPWNTWAEKAALVTSYCLHLLLLPTHPSPRPRLRTLPSHTRYLEHPLFTDPPSNLLTEVKQDPRIISPLIYSSLIFRKVVILPFGTITWLPLVRISSLPTHWHSGRLRNFFKFIELLGRWIKAQVDLSLLIMILCF